MKRLIAFDFDHTLIDDNSDLYVRKLAPGGKIPEEISALYSTEGWTDYMAAIFRCLHSNKKTKDDIFECLKEISFVDGIVELLAYLVAENFDVIIISDANSVFIDCILEAAQLRSVISEVYTNPAHFDDNGCLILKMYQVQDWCKLSTVNLCKGYILDEHIKNRASQGVHYDFVAYVGDGSNDYCPALHLKNTFDVVFPRKGFSLIDMLNDTSRTETLKCRVEPWSNGTEIMNVLKDTLPKLAS